MVRGLGGFLSFPDSGNQLVRTLETQIPHHLSSSLLYWLDPLWYSCLGLMIIDPVVTMVKSMRKPAWPGQGSVQQTSSAPRSPRQSVPVLDLPGHVSESREFSSVMLSWIPSASSTTLSNRDH